MADSNNTLENDCVRLTFDQDAGQVSGFSFSVRANGVWQRMGSTRPLSRVIYRDGAGNRCEWDCLARVVSASTTQVCLEAGQTDADGVAWKLRLTFALADNPHQIALTYVLETGERRGLLHWVGPAIHAGEGSFGASCEEAIFPGLEYLLNGEPSSDTAFASEKHARRYMPHPYKITIPLMAVGDAGRAVGLMWDPNQDWYNAWRHPAALFSSPNRLEAGAQNHWLALCAPAVEPRFRDENELEAHSPCTGSKWTLSARLVAVPGGGIVGILRQWVQTYGLPALPLPQKPDFGVAYNACQKSGFLTRSDAA
ncbi:MAG: hypothetical protein M1546_06955, partial [Chloroflexi bacterium]|nr:hypothetical protein [Chloroflexota bacterium]